MKKIFFLTLLLVFLFSTSSILAQSAGDLYVGTNESQRLTNPSQGWSNIYIGPTNFSDNQVTYRLVYDWQVIGTTVIGYSPLSSNNRLTMEDAGISFGKCIVGSNSSANSLYVRIGEGYCNDEFSIGLSGGNQNLLILEDCSWTNNNGIYVGNDLSYSNSVIVTGGASLVPHLIVVGYSSADYNSVIVTGADILGTPSSLSFSTEETNLIVGYGGNSNQLIITNGGVVSAYAAVIGQTNGDNGNNITIDGSNSFLTISDTNYFPFIVGLNGFNNSFTLTNGAIFSCYYGLIGYGLTASNNQAFVTDGSIWTNYQNFYVGVSGKGNSLIVSNGGKIIVTGTASGSSLFGSSYIGLFSSSNQVVVTGSNSLWSNSGNLFVGNRNSNNSLLIEDGGSVVDYDSLTYIVTNDAIGTTVTNYTTNFAGTIGGWTNYEGDSVTLSGSNSLWSNCGSVAVGYSGYGNALTINEGTVFDTNGYIGYNILSSNNTAIISGADSLWTNSGNFYVGYRGPSNTMIITNGGQVIDQNGYVGYASTSFKNAVILEPNSLWSNSGNLYIGTTNNTTIPTGQGSVTVNNGTVIAQNIYVGRTSSYNSSGSTTLAKNLYLQGGRATLSYIGADIVTLGSALHGKGHLKIDGDTVNFTGDNNYTGITEILSGRAIASTSNAFGASDVFLGERNKKIEATLEVSSNIACSISTFTINNSNSTLQLNNNSTLSIKKFDVGTNTINLTLNNYHLSSKPKEIIKWKMDNRKGHEIFSLTNPKGVKKIETNNKVLVYIKPSPVH